VDQNVVSDDGGVDAETPCVVGGQPPFVQTGGFMGEIGSTATVFFGYGNQQYTVFARLCPQFAVDLVGLSKSVVVRDDFVGHEFTGHLAKVRVLFGFSDGVVVV